MRAAALVVLASCAAAPTRPPAPASAPVVLKLRIDPSLEGNVLSRKAAEQVLAQRIDMKARHEAELADLGAELRIAQMTALEQSKRANRYAWWGTWGPVVVGAGAAGAFGLGVLLAMLLQLAFGR